MVILEAALDMLEAASLAKLEAVAWPCYTADIWSGFGLLSIQRHFKPHQNRFIHGRNINNNEKNLTQCCAGLISTIPFSTFHIVLI